MIVFPKQRCSEMFIFKYFRNTAHCILPLRDSKDIYILKALNYLFSNYAPYILFRKSSATFVKHKYFVKNNENSELDFLVSILKLKVSIYIKGEKKKTL